MPIALADPDRIGAPLPAKWITRLAPAVLAIAMVTATAAPAHAANSQLVLYTVAHGDVASILHIDDGDKFYVKDHYPDGHGVRGYLQLLETGTWRQVDTAYNGNGSGTTIAFQYDIQSGYTYRMRVCLVDGSGDTTPTPCAYKELHE